MSVFIKAGRRVGRSVGRSVIRNARRDGWAGECGQGV